jgi:hypothetical protein
MDSTCQGGTLEFVAEVVKVFRADLHLQDFFDHRHEVGQGTDCTQGRHAPRPYHAPRGSQDERVLDRLQLGDHSETGGPAATQILLV